MPRPDAAALEKRHQIERIYITGFMGAGKSTVGPLLAALLGWRFVDIDKLVEEQQGRKVSALFETLGEPAFRLMELDALRTLCRQVHCVVSLGGGALETENVRSLLAKDEAARLVFLEAPLHLLLQRCKAQEGAVTRPLLHHADQDSGMIRERYEKRLTHYQKAHLTVATQDLTPEEVAASIYQQMAAFT